MRYRIFKTWEYIEWLEEENQKSRVQIGKRLAMIELEGYFGNHKSVSENHAIWELKWDNGRRVYYAYVPEAKIILLLGGNKNGQSKDIAQAKKILKEYIEDEA